MLTFKISSGLLFVLVFTNYQNNDTCLERHKETYHNKTQKLQKKNPKTFIYA